MIYLWWKILIAKAFAFTASTVALYALVSVPIPEAVQIVAATIGGIAVGLLGAGLTHATYYASPGESPGLYRTLRAVAWAVLIVAAGALMTASPSLGMVVLATLVQSAMAPGVSRRVSSVWRRWVRQEHRAPLGPLAAVHPDARRPVAVAR